MNPRRRTRRPKRLICKVIGRSPSHSRYLAERRTKSPGVIAYRRLSTGNTADGPSGSAVGRGKHCCSSPRGKTPTSGSPRSPTSVCARSSRLQPRRSAFSFSRWSSCRIRDAHGSTRAPATIRDALGHASLSTAICTSVPLRPGDEACTSSFDVRVCCRLDSLAFGAARFTKTVPRARHTQTGSRRKQPPGVALRLGLRSCSRSLEGPTSLY